jgi:molecular chaperone DnaK (HSP70)
MFSKRRIGTTELIPVATEMVTAREVATRFLRYLKDCAEKALGRPVTRAVITHPAYFDRGAVEETRAAGREAGFDMSLSQQMLMEPVAAALCYTRADPRDPLRILTYDLGGGTFDVTYLERRGGVIRVHSFDGNHLLGGYNFDLALVHSVLARLEKSGRKIHLDENDPEDRGRLARLLRLAEDVKIKLSKVGSDADAIEFRALKILVDDRGRPVQVNERFTRRQFVELIQSYLDDVLLCCRRTLEKGKVRAEDLHEILLVGGSSRGPWVLDSLKTVFPGATPRLFEPDLCVGAGAAIHARMALPRDLESAPDAVNEYRVTLEAPESTLLEQIHVAGQVVRKRDGQPPAEGLTAALCPAEGPAPTPVPLARTGRFLFPNVELIEHAENKFTLRLADAAKRVVYEQSFFVQQGTTSGVATTMTVLPRPLYIETSRGMVALAEEGVALPARRVAEFERSNANASMDLRLFQEEDPVGVVQVKNIPREAGAGSPVVLTLEITADNHVQGDVAIYRLIMDRSGKVVDRKEALRGKIDVSFDPTVIPPREELADQFCNAQEQLQRVREQNPDFAEEIAAEATSLVERIERILAQPIVERQEVHVALRKLRNLLVPPKDEMSPTRLEFKRQARGCRELMQGLRSRAQEKIEATGGADGEDQEKEKAKCERSLKRLAELDARLGVVEQEALAAHTRKDRAAWANRHATLEKIEANIGEVKKLLIPGQDFEKHMHELLAQAPFLLKILVLEQEIKPLKAMLTRHAAILLRQGKLEEWRAELDDINQQLDAAAQGVIEIDDTIDAQQIRAKIQVILRILPGLRTRIDAIGKNLR